MSMLWNSRSVGLVLAVCINGVVSPFSLAQPFYSLVSGNSQLDINLSASTHTTVYNWLVEGVDHMQEFSNWYRVGGSSSERQLSSVPITSISAVGTDQLLLEYTDTQNRFRVDARYGVVGGAPGSGYSTMGECVTVTNTSTSPLSFNLFEYLNLDLSSIQMGHTPGDDVAWRLNSNRLEQFDNVTTFNMSYGSSSHHEIAYHSSILTRLLDNSPTTLTDAPASFLSPIGPPGNMEFALQYDMFLLPGGQFQVCKDCELQMVIPEPSSFALCLTAWLVVFCRPNRYQQTAHRA